MNLKSDIEIAQNTKDYQLKKLHKKLTFGQRRLNFMAMIKLKISWKGINRIKKNQKLGKLILVTSISPTPAGKGKSTITIGLGDAIRNHSIKTL